MLGHRLRRWPTIDPTLGECFVFAGTSHVYWEGGGCFPVDWFDAPSSPDGHMIMPSIDYTGIYVD